MPIRAIAFDAYGTLYDVHSVRSRAIALCGEKGELITQLWRLKQLEYSWLRSLMRDYQDFWSVTRAALDFSLASLGGLVRFDGWVVRVLQAAARR